MLLSIQKTPLETFSVIKSQTDFVNHTVVVDKLLKEVVSSTSQHEMDKVSP